MGMQLTTAPLLFMATADLVDGGAVTHGVNGSFAADDAQVFVREDGPEMPLRPLRESVRQLRGTILKGADR